MSEIHKKMRDLPEVRRLPATYATQIGRVISRWAYQEWLLTRVMYELLGLSPKAGRLAVKTGNINTYMQMLSDLMRVYPIQVPTNMNKLWQDLAKAESERDHLAHGLWLKESGSPSLRLWHTRGRKVVDAGEPTVSRKHRPDSLPKSPNDIGNTCKTIDDLIVRTRILEKEIRAALASLSAEALARVRL